MNLRLIPEGYISLYSPNIQGTLKFLYAVGCIHP